MSTGIPIPSAAKMMWKPSDIAICERAKKRSFIPKCAFAEKDQRHQIMRIARINARTNLANAKEQYASMLSDEKPLRYYAIKFSDPPVYFNSVAFLPERRAHKSEQFIALI